MKESVRGAILLIIIGIIAILLIWGLASPPTTIESPLFFILESALVDVPYIDTEAAFFCDRADTVLFRFT